MNTISIIIRTHNEEQWIGLSLRKVLEQTIEDIEVVLVDNQSTDKTVEKARHICPDLTLVKIEDYRPGLAINEGIRTASGDYIVCLSAHCIPVDDHWLEHLYHNFQEEDDIAGVYGRQLPMESTDPIDKRDLIRTFGPERRVQEQDTFFHNANSMIRRDVWAEIPFREDVTNIEDQIWGNAVTQAGYKIVYDPDAAVYHHHGINQSNDEERTANVVQTMENQAILPEDTQSNSVNGNPLDPYELDVVSFIPIRHQAEVGVDFDEDLIQRTVDAANESEYIDRTIVLPDIELIIEKAESWGVEAPYLRPPELSERDVEVIEVFQFGLSQIESDGYFPDLIVPLEITHPFRPPGLLDEMIGKLVKKGLDTVVASHPEFRPCWLEEDDSLVRVNEDSRFRKDRQTVQVGLVSLGCVTHPHHIREGTRLGGDLGTYELQNPLSTIEIRHREDIQFWDRLKEVDLFEAERRVATTED